MKATQASKAVRAWLESNNVQASDVSARTVSFQDLARGDCIFVTVRGFLCGQPGQADALETFARSQGFRVHIR